MIPRNLSSRLSFSRIARWATVLTALVLAVAVGGLAAQAQRATVAKSVRFSGKAQVNGASFWPLKFLVKGRTITAFRTTVRSNCGDTLAVSQFRKKDTVRKGKFTLRISADTPGLFTSGTVRGTIKGRHASGRLFGTYFKQVPGLRFGDPSRTTGCAYDTKWSAKRRG